jgi:hypothetical protein
MQAITGRDGVHRAADPVAGDTENWPAMERDGVRAPVREVSAEGSRGSEKEEGVANIVRGGLIQMSLPTPSEVDGDKGAILAQKQAMIEKHLPFIDQAGQEGVHMLCLQEIF